MTLPGVLSVTVLSGVEDPWQSLSEESGRILEEPGKTNDTFDPDALCWVHLVGMPLGRSSRGGWCVVHRTVHSSCGQLWITFVGDVIWNTPKKVVHRCAVCLLRGIEALP